MEQLQLKEPCENRPIRFLELLEFDGWRIKTYSIAYKRDLARPELVAIAKELAASTFPRPAVIEKRYGLGYLGIHDGRGCSFVFTDWWEDENELHHRVFISQQDDFTDLEDRTATGVSACVWDLRLQCFERQAWLDTVLRNPDGPNFEAYLSARLNVDA